MTTPRRRTRATAKKEAVEETAHAQTENADTSDWMSSGAGILEDSKTAKEEASQRMADNRQPRRFWLAANAAKGDTTKEIVILNESFDTAMGVLEHEIWKKSERKCIYRASPKKFENDPLIEITGKEPYFVTYLTVLTLVEWTDKNGEVHEYSRELIGIKNSQLDAFWKIATAAIKKNGTLRGTVLLMERDTNNHKSPKIGFPAILDDGTLFDFIPEDELIEEFGHDAVVTKQGKEIFAENEFLNAYKNHEIYSERPSADALIKEFGGGRGLGGDDDDKFSPTATPERRTRRKALAPESDDSADDGGVVGNGEDFEDDPLA